MFLFHGIQQCKIDQPNPMGAELVALATQDLDTAHDTDPAVHSPIPITHQQAVVFGVAADLGQQQRSRVQTPVLSSLSHGSLHLASTCT